ncbi:hypothetical protein ASE63_08250 [Bosea sp. Root381]|uniref:phage tail protein n=1 Tax=Bosea sp. Root381 TaxID=1736524 RepID=UPI0006F98B20|nr:phage tail protein [Bosea sp. Root381]KRE00084.1 hypothetical protein ASE63_08250 [Bosea sp. Root381]
MPVAVGAAVLTTVGATTLAASATAAYVVGSIVITGALVGASYAMQTLSAQKPLRERQQATLNEAMGPRRFIYGQAMVGGTRAFWDARYGALFQSLMLCSHEIDGIAEYWIGDRKVTTDLGEAGGNVIDYPLYTVFFERHLGTPGQTAALLLTTNFPETWTADHRLRGIAHVCVVFKGVKEKDRQLVYPQGAYTNLRFTVRGKKIWDVTAPGQDPENPGTWLWNDNSGAVILDYLRSPDGYRRHLSQIDVPSFQAFHLRCSENVPRKDGTPVARYRTWGTIGFDEEPQAALARLCSTCDATLYQGPSGKIGIRDGAWTGPLINIPSQHITGAALTQGNDKLDSYNRLKVSYTEPNNYYQPTELAPRDDLPSQAAIGVIEEVRDLVMVPEYTQAARLAKIMMARDNPLWKGSIATDLMPLDVLGEKAVDITYDPLGDGLNPLMNAPCEIEAFTLRGDVSGCDLGFRAMPQSAWSWNAAVEEPPKPIAPAPIGQIQAIAAPTGLITHFDRPNIAGQVGVRLGLSWDASSRADVVAEAQYARAGLGDWAPMALDADGLKAWTPLLSDGASYEFQVRFAVGGAVSDWTPAGPLTAVADDLLTGQPLGFVANGGTGQVLLAWTAPGSPNLGAVRLYRATSGAGFGSASIVATVNLSPNQAYDMVDSGLSAGTYDYWARALNRSGLGDASSTTGPISATVS